MVGGMALPADARTGNLQFIGRAHVKGRKKWMKHVLVSISMFGLQLVWSTEMAYASPYLLSLGLSKAGMSAVFLAGPLSGLLVQPVIGSIADRSKSRFGRRRPVIVIGCAICVVSLLIFGYTREVASIVTTSGSNAHNTLTIWLAVLAVYALDFGINGVQATDRALIVDVLPVSQQEEANAWVARLSGIGSIVGFWVGNVDLLGWFSFLGDSQIKILSVFASLALIAAHAVTIFSVEERILLDDGQTDEFANSQTTWTNNQFTQTLASLWQTFRVLPVPIWDICKVQAFAWGGWFPILFFSSTYVAEIYSDSHDFSGSSSQSQLQEGDPATRAGSRALFLHALVSFICSIVLPFFVSTPTAAGTISGSHSDARNPLGTKRRSSIRHMAWSESILDKIITSRFIPTLPLPWLDLTALWMVAHAAFAFLMFTTWFIGSVWSATLMLAVLGFCWSVTAWAPTSLLGQEILQDTSPALKARMRASQEYGRAPLSDNNESFALQDTSHHARVNHGDSNVSIFITPNATVDDEPTNSKASQPDSHADPDPYPGRTLKIRHSDSFDGSSYQGSSDESDNGIRTDEIHNPLASMQPSTGTLPDRGQTLDLEEQDLALGREAEYLATGGLAGETRTADQAGAILGIANVFVVLPQFMTSFISSIVFAFTTPSDANQMTAPVDPKLQIRSHITAALLRRAGIHVPSGGNDAIGLVFRIGGVSALVAAWLAWRMRKRKLQELS